jgi:two-component system, sensor histidine kinase YesM
MIHSTLFYMANFIEESRMVKKLLLKYSNMRIRNKIVVIYLPLIILPLFLIIYTSNYIFSKSIIEKAHKNIADESKLIVMRLSEMYSNVERYANTVSRDIDRVYNELPVNNEDRFIARTAKISTIMSYDTRTYKDIESAVFIDNNSNIITSSSGIINNNGKLFDLDLIKTLNKPVPPGNVWFPMQIRDFLVTSKKAPVLTVGKKLLDNNTGSIIGFLILNIKEETISSIFPDAVTRNAKGYFIIDKNGIVISSRNKQDLLKPIESNKIKQWALQRSTPQMKVEIRKIQQLVTSSDIKELNWKLINQIPISDLTSDIYINSLIIIIIGITCIIFVFISTFFLSRLIANPIIKLTRTAQEIKKGNLDIYNKVDSNDEVGILASVFNEMIEKIKELLEKVKSDQKKKREYELAVLQSQIKPHFLYNTIETINMFIRLDMKEKALKTTDSLANFYRISLSKGSDIITLGEEIRLIESYLSIQSFRYVDYMDYEINVPEEILKYNIPKLTLQPLVENAIYHGLKHRKDKGHLEISGSKKGNYIVITVADDGVGISKEKISEILVPSNQSPLKVNFGVNSVNNRIKLLYGNESGLEIESKVNEYTKAKVVLQIQEG